MRKLTVILIGVTILFHVSCQSNGEGKTQMENDNLRDTITIGDSVLKDTTVKPAMDSALLLPMEMETNMYKLDTGKYSILERMTGKTKVSLLYRDSLPFIVHMPAYDDSGEESGIVKFYFLRNGIVYYLIDGGDFRTVKVLSGNDLHHYTKRGKQQVWGETEFPNQLALEGKIEEFKQELHKASVLFPEFKFTY